MDLISVTFYKDLLPASQRMNSNHQSVNLFREVIAVCSKDCLQHIFFLGEMQIP